MKFLVLRKPRLSGGIIPTGKAIREHKHGALEAIKAGAIDCIYAFPAGGGSVAIANADSAEQLNESSRARHCFLTRILKCVR